MKPCVRLITGCCLLLLIFSPLAAAQRGPQLSPSPATVDNPYHTYENMTSTLQSLATNHSGIMELFSIGTTYEGRSIWAVKISADVHSEEGRPQALFLGAHHGNEKPGAEVCIRFIQYLVDTYGVHDIDNDHDGRLNEDPLDGVDNDHDGLIDEDPSESYVNNIINTTEIFVIPMVNPDGYAANERKNHEPNHGSFGFNPLITSFGVDINRNYGYKWNWMFLFPQRYLSATGINDKSVEYRGPYPFSTAEAKAVRTLVVNYTFAVAISYHTFGKEILYPWGYTRLPPKDVASFKSIGKNISLIDGYELGQSIDLYPTLGDTCDWLYGDYGVLAFTIELGTSYAPPNSEIVRILCTQHIGVNLYVCACAKVYAK